MRQEGTFSASQVNELSGVKEPDTGLAPPALWDIAADKQAMQQEQRLQVARCTKIIIAEGQDHRRLLLRMIANSMVTTRNTTKITSNLELKKMISILTLSPFII
ncbi:hypothetical protein PRIPAC_98107 [Pristionchus pacificus]|uniref:Uncharacterized protein n=2 Tax=Pristionchus pacificus TaxID=54126 RepID=A0A2A6CUP4_PRIPA|nr:hypothetical protein PRIPAC_98107 [Pristionchus pacificus]|eukprot:PDM81952.1 hypothetical protein PRIPAC_35221 [Pristionchus pacificus]